jgi:glutaredoxin
MTMHHTVTLYGKKECCLCDEALEVLQKVQASLPFDLQKIDISGNAELLEKFGHKIPVIFIDGIPSFKYRVNERRLRSMLTAQAGASFTAVTMTDGADRADRDDGT